MQKLAEKEKTYHLPDEHRQVLNVIRNTSNKYITKTQILNQLGLEVNKANERWLRLTINSLILQYQYPIGYNYSKTRRGYYMIENELDRRNAIASIQRQIEGSQARIDAIEEMRI
ncbi:MULTISPECIES: hypothetical protein [Staphylococcus]|uniref:hypothetical protein n=1 Tax=Staphylococcus TaxID=1279 RepID=UPI0001A5CE2C|nr:MULTISPECIES: hypothetical protein [Staphylococcus]EEQ79706.1 pathogenicity island protein [Staphylococcus warneri L37603]MBF0770053.1 pathogenicity island protein [Staphylococcus warneri]MCI2748821.1 pathogenicity island protein [Staphylococcus warneri]MCI2768075.1 pathogenicity island protein [Staphylococcus warneri]MCI2772953.1 pathogenicity island protein [Staphylococcus warneri]